MDNHMAGQLVQSDDVAARTSAIPNTSALSHVEEGHTASVLSCVALFLMCACALRFVTLINTWHLIFKCGNSCLSTQFKLLAEML